MIDDNKKQYIIENYENTRTDVLMQETGLTQEQVHRIAAKNKIKKSKDVIREVARERSLDPNHGIRFV